MFSLSHIQQLIILSPFNSILRTCIYILTRCVKLNESQFFFFSIQECYYTIPEVLIVQSDMHYLARVCESSSKLILFCDFHSQWSSRKFSLVLINTNDFFFFGVNKFYHLTIHPLFQIANKYRPEGMAQWSKHQI